MLTALGFRAHSGWAALVALTEPVTKPTIVMSRIITTADPSIVGSKQPFHAAEGLSYEEARKHIHRCTESSRHLSRKAIEQITSDLRLEGHRVIGLGALVGSARPLPPLESILRSHPLLHTAEGELFRNVIIEAAEHCGIPVVRVNEKELFVRCERLASRTTLDKHLTELGRLIGPPWRQDEKFAALAAWLALTPNS